MNKFLSLIVILFTIIISLTVTNASYDLSAQDIALVNTVTTKIEKIIEKRWEPIRKRIIALLQGWLKKYGNNPRMVAILEKTIEDISSDELSLDSLYWKENLNKQDQGNSATETIVQFGDLVAVDYLGKLEDGTVFDSSLEELAKKSSHYDSGRKYEPLEFTVWAGQMIKGFEAGVIGMQLGEKKTLVIAPKDAYGELYIEQEIPAKYFQDVFTETAPLDNFKDYLTQTVPMSALGDKSKNLSVGKVIESDGIKAKVTKIEGDNVTIDIENTQNPFYGKKMKVGLKTVFEGNDVTIKNMTDTEVILEVQNKANPFYGKQIREGMEGIMTNGSKMKVLKIGKENFIIAVRNTHELAWKTVQFDVEIKSIKKNHSLAINGAPHLVKKTPHSVVLEWDKVPGAEAYIIKYSKTSVANSKDQNAQYDNETDQVTDTTVRITELASNHEPLMPGTAYYFSVIAIDKNGKESDTFSDELMITLPLEYEN